MNNDITRLSSFQEASTTVFYKIINRYGGSSSSGRVVVEIVWRANVRNMTRMGWEPLKKKSDVAGR